MKASYFIVACLGGMSTVVSGCTGQDPEEPAHEEPAAESEQALELPPIAPPVVNSVHDDIAYKLQQYSGYPMAGKKTPGMIAAVVKGKHIVALGAAGWAKLDPPTYVPMTEDMVFNIGSNTKSITATLLSILIYEHPPLWWEMPLAQALPWASASGKEYIEPVARRNVTLRDIAGHRSGIVCSYPGPGNTVIPNTDFPHEEYPYGWRDKTREQLLKEYLRGDGIVVGGQPNGILADCQGTIGDYAYENENFAILQAVIEHWSGMSFLEYAQQKLIAPNSMGNTFLPSQAYLLAQSGSIIGDADQRAYWNPYFFQPSHPRLAAGKYAFGHGTTGSTFPILNPDYDPWGLAPGRGGFAFDIVDWSRYATLHLRDTSQAIRKIHKPNPDPDPDLTYEFGWDNLPLETPGGIPFRSLCHNGSIDGMVSRICVYPEIDLAYLTFANGGPQPQSANDNMIVWMRDTPAYARDSGGCADDPDYVVGVQRFWDQEMFGCAGSVTFAERNLMCKAGYHVCSAQEYVTNNTYYGNNAEAPKHHYWTNDNLRYGGTSESCWASTSSGTVCGGGATPMRVCAPGGTDTEGNECNWDGCGFGQNSTADRHFGGCAGNTTAGALCCKD